MDDEGWILKPFDTNCNLPLFKASALHMLPQKAE